MPLSATGLNDRRTNLRVETTTQGMDEVIDAITYLLKKD